MVATSGKPDSAISARTRRSTFVLIVIGVIASAVLVLAPLGPAVTVIAAALVIAICVTYPAVALCLIPFAVAFGSLASVSVHGVSVGPTDALVGGLSLSWLIRHAQQLRRALAEPGALLARLRLGAVAIASRDRMRAATFAALLAYLAVIVLSLAVATDRISAIKEAVKWSEVAVTLALALWLLRTPLRLRALVWCAIAAGVAEALLGLAQWAVPNGMATDLRVYGTFAQPNPFAGYLNLALPLAAALAIFGKDVRERWIAGGASAVLLVALLFSTSRGGLLGLLAAVATLALAGVRKPRFVVPALVGAVALVALAWVTQLIPSSLQQRVLHALRLEDLSLNGAVTSQNFSTMERLAHWVAGLRMFVAHPILGVGAGNYDAAYARYVVDPTTWPDSLGHAHNYYINTAAETGVLGLLTFLAFTACTLLAAWMLVRRVSSPGSHAASPSVGRDLAPRALALGLFAVFVAFTVHNATDDLFVHGMELQFALYVACILARRQIAGDAT